MSHKWETEAQSAAQPPKATARVTKLRRYAYSEAERRRFSGRLCGNAEGSESESNVIKMAPTKKFS